MGRRRKDSLPDYRSWTFSRNRIETLGRLFVACLFLTFLLLLNLTALPVPHFGLIKPHLFLVAVYYWAIYRPTLVPPWFCFLAGLVLDILSGMPPGIQAFVFVIVQGTVRSQRQFLTVQPYVTNWAIFSLICGLVAATQWGLYGFANAMVWPSPVPAAAAVLVTLCLFPPITMVLIWTHRMLPVASRPYP